MARRGHLCLFRGLLAHAGAAGSEARGRDFVAVTMSDISAQLSI